MRRAEFVLRWMRDIGARPYARRAATAASALGMLGLLLYMVGTSLDVLAGAQWHVIPGRLVIALGVLSVPPLMAAFVWGDIVLALGGTGSRGRHARAHAQSLLARRLPGGLWHLAGRAAFYGADAGGVRIAMTASALEAGGILIVGVIILLAVLPGSEIWGPLIGVVAASISLAVAPRAARIVRARVPLPRPRVALWLLCGALSWSAGCSGVYLLYGALYPLPEDSFLPLSVAVLASVLIGGLAWVLPGGLGLRELGLTALMASFIPPPIGIALAIAFRIITTTLDLLWAFVILRLTAARVTAGGGSGQ
ncbi:MAG: hypothetical protein FJ033_06720 [Chloroflexi bacterium]|nr:hypothetical protein [Chloroflexota bacterium]